jgi:hypothetical protein
VLSARQVLIAVAVAAVMPAAPASGAPEHAEIAFGMDGGSYAVDLRSRRSSLG